MLSRLKSQTQNPFQNRQRWKTGAVYYPPISRLAPLLTLASLLLFAESKTYWGDVRVLKALKRGIDPNSVSSGSCLSSWDFTLDPCDSLFTAKFTCGFRCDVVISGRARVTELTLDSAGYSGSLASAPWNLANHLEALDLSGNFFSGSIPDSLGNASRLRRLGLSRNSFSGEIPRSIGSLNFLEELYLDNNNLTGSLPSGLTSLKRLEVQSNRLSGRVPHLGSLKNLSVLDASDNFISGEIPTNFPASILQFTMRNNCLRGSIPSTIKDSGFLQVLDLSQNQLTGRVPSVFFTHPSLQQLSLSHNRLTSIEAPPPDGPNPKNELIAVDLSYNQVEGFLPDFMAAMPKLSALSLENNRLTGEIPVMYAWKTVIPAPGVSRLGRLLLGGNYLMGIVPPPLMSLKLGDANVNLADNCLNVCPEDLFFCGDGKQKSESECKQPSD